MVELEQVKAALRVLYPKQGEAGIAGAAKAVWFEFEVHGPVTEVDRLFLGGPDGDASDAAVLVERTLVRMRERNALRARARGAA